jgi:hypothetical protein
VDADDPQIEEAIRSYFAASGEDAARLSAGVLAEFLEVTRDFDDPVTVRSQRLSVRRLEVVRIDDDRAEVAIEATDHLTYETAMFENDEGERQTDRLLIEGPMLLHRIDGVWKVADYSRNGRRRSESIRLHPPGAQEVDGVRVIALAADLQAGYTMIYLRVTNPHESDLVFDWAALGIPRTGSWRYLPLGVLPSTFHTGDTVAAAWMWKEVSLDIPALRLVVLPKGRRVGFDFVVGTAGAEGLEALQPAPTALPFRLRIRRSPFFQLLPLLTLVPVFLFGGWPAVGFTMFLFGAWILGSLVRNRLKGRRFPIRRPAVAGIGLLAAGLVLFVATGIEFAGCPPRSEAGPVANRFVEALLTRGPDEAARYLSTYAEPIENQLPRLPRISEGRAAKILEARSEATAAECSFLVNLVPGADTMAPCFIYRLSTRKIMVFMECDFDEWKVAGLG